MKTINYVFQLLIRKSRVNSLITLVALSIALIFSFNSVAATVTGTYFSSRCVQIGSPSIYERARRSIHIEPDNSRTQYYFGVVSFCLGYKEDALRAFKKSSNLKNPFASLAMAWYYLSEGTWKTTVETKDLKNLIESTAFYERARMQIAEYGDAYPPEEFKIMEGMTRASIMTTAVPPNMLFNIYAHLVINTVKEPGSSIVSSITATALDTLSIQEAQASSNTQLSDLRRRLSLDNTIPPTIAILKRMQLSAQSCLDKWQNQTSPTVWQEDYPDVLDSVQIICESYVVLAKNSLPLEKQRLVAIEKCEEEELSECDEYDAIVNKLVDESYARVETVRGAAL